MRTTTIVHASEIDTDKKLDDIIYQLRLRLSRRLGHDDSWAAIGPIPIRRSRCERAAAHTYQIQVISPCPVS